MRACTRVSTGASCSADMSAYKVDLLTIIRGLAHWTFVPGLGLYGPRLGFVNDKLCHADAAPVMSDVRGGAGHGRVRIHSNAGGSRDEILRTRAGVGCDARRQVGAGIARRAMARRRSSRPSRHAARYMDSRQTRPSTRSRRLAAWRNAHVRREPALRRRSRGGLRRARQDYIRHACIPGRHAVVLRLDAVRGLHRRQRRHPLFHPRGCARADSVGGTQRRGRGTRGAPDGPDRQVRHGGRH